MDDLRVKKQILEKNKANAGPEIKKQKLWFFAMIVFLILLSLSINYLYPYLKKFIIELAV